MVSFVCCKECEKRYPGCQDHCEEYKKVKEIQKIEAEKLKKYRKKYLLPLSRKKGMRR